MSAWMAEHIAPDGQVVALDLDLSLVDNADVPGVEFRQGDIVTGPVDPGCVDVARPPRLGSRASGYRRR